jgi:hypothetical protein
MAGGLPSPGMLRAFKLNGTIDTATRQYLLCLSHVRLDVRAESTRTRWLPSFRLLHLHGQGRGAPHLPASGLVRVSAARTVGEMRGR